MENLIKCPNGHFYNSDEYRACPYCQQSTIPGTIPNGGHKRYENEAGPTIPDFPPEDIGVTIGVYDGVSKVSPVTGWLVCIEGTQKGRDFRLCAGRNYIGRGTDMDICLEGDSRVSRSRHAIVIFDPRSQTTLCQAGDSRELFYHNEKVVTNTAELQQGDILQTGDSKLIFVSFCGSLHTWEEK